MRRIGRWLALVLAICGAVPPAFAEATLLGRTVTFQILTYDDRDRPLFVGRTHTARVGNGQEFGLRYEGAQNDLDVVPILVDISADRMEVRYENAIPGELAEAAFNGYVFGFATDCLLFQGARVDRRFTNLPITDNKIFVERGTLFINVAGLRYDRYSRFAINFEVGDCRLM